MLIKNEKSKASCLSVPTISAEHSVEPLLEIPGNKATVCASPIYNAVERLTGLNFSFFRLTTIKENEEIKNPQIKVLIEKLSSKNLLNTNAPITAGMVAIIKLRVVEFFGWRIRLKIFFL